MTRGFAPANGRALGVANRAITQSVIPDSGNLQSRYAADEGVINTNGNEASVGETADTVRDLTGNGYKLSAVGAPELREASDGNLYLWYDGVDDRHQHTQSLGVTQPAEVWVAAELETADGTRQDIVSGRTSGATDSFLIYTDGTNFAVYAGVSLSGPTEDTNRHIMGGVYDGAGSALDFDGSEASSGDAGTRDLDTDWYLGYSEGGSVYANVRIHEVLMYVNRDDTRRSDVRDYLNDKWSAY